MTILYNTAIKIYLFFIRMAAPFNRKAGLWVKGRKGIFKKLEEEINRDKKLAWFHCASLGEFEQGRPLIEEFKRKFPDYQILLTFFSPSGYEVRKNYSGADHVFYLPADSASNARKFIRAVNPEIAFFIKYEFWYHYFDALYRNEIPFFVISANFREDQHFFQWYGKWFRKMLLKVSHIFVQNRDSLGLLELSGIHNCTISGDTRFDRVITVAQNTEAISIIEHFKGQRKILIAGSTWQEDEALLVRHINSEKLDIKYILAPHVVHPEDVKDLAGDISRKTVLLSTATRHEAEEADVLIVDSVGQLSKIYRYGDIAYIGGGFGAGIHNVLEPAAYGMPVIFGPNYEKFKEAIELLVKGGAFEVGSYNDLQHCIDFLLKDHLVLMMASEVSKGYVNENKGATERVMEKVGKFVV